MTEHKVQHKADRVPQEVRLRYNIIIFRIKLSMLTPDYISLNFINKLLLYAERGLKSTDQRFSEAAVAFDSVIPAKSCPLMTQLSGCAAF